jgi:hypothetical protein
MPTPYDIFQYNIGKSIGLLRLLQWKHFIRELGMNLPYLPGLSEIKNQIIKSIDDRTLITDVGLYQQCIVTSMTAVEVYLSDIFDIPEIPKKSQPKKRISFQYLKTAEEAYKQYCGLKLFKDVQTKIDFSFLMEVRHNVIHKGGTIDQKFMENCSGKNKKYDYCCFDSKYVTDRSKFQEEHELNFLFDDEMIESIHKDVKSFIEDVHSKTGL